MTPLILACGAGGLIGFSVASVLFVLRLREAQRKAESASKRYLQLVSHCRKLHGRIGKAETISPG